MRRRFGDFVDNEKSFYTVIIILLFLIILLSKLTTVGTTLCFFYFLMGLFYTHLIRRSIKWANTIFRQVIWLSLIPLLISFIPILLLMFIFNSSTLSDSITLTLYTMFFILTWVTAVFVFDLSKIRVAVQFINAIVLSILGITFILYFNSEIIKFLFSKQMLNDLNSIGIGPESFFDIMVKLTTLPYFLACLWANFAIEFRSYKVKVRCESLK